MSNSASGLGSYCTIWQGRLPLVLLQGSNDRSESGLRRCPAHAVNCTMHDIRTGLGAREHRGDANASGVVSVDVYRHLRELFPQSADQHPVRKRTQRLQVLSETLSNTHAQRFNPRDGLVPLAGRTAGLVIPFTAPLSGHHSHLAASGLSRPAMSLIPSTCVWPTLTSLSARFR